MENKTEVLNSLVNLPQKLKDNTETIEKANQEIKEVKRQLGTVIASFTKSTTAIEKIKESIKIQELKEVEEKFANTIELLKEDLNSVIIKDVTNQFENEIDNIIKPKIADINKANTELLNTINTVTIPTLKTISSFNEDIAKYTNTEDLNKILATYTNTNSLNDKLQAIRDTHTNYKTENDARSLNIENTIADMYRKSYIDSTFALYYTKQEMDTKNTEINKKIKANLDSITNINNNIKKKISQYCEWIESNLIPEKALPLAS